MEHNYDFSGWATKNDIRCADGRIIRKDAFKNCDGVRVPLVFNHDHRDVNNVLGHAILENRAEGVYAYCTFNDTESGQAAKQLVEHKDVSQLSIYANKLKQKGSDVLHGAIKELSLVLAGANPGAIIDSIISHGEESDEEAIIYTGEDITLSHAEDDSSDADNLEHACDPKKKKVENKTLTHVDEKKTEEIIVDENKKPAGNGDKTVGEVFDTLNEEQKTAVWAIIGQAVTDAGDTDDEGDDNKMKHNVFDQDEKQGNVLTHSDQESIIALAKTNSVGSLRDAMEMYAENNDHLAHGIDEIETLFPEYKDVRPGAPELIERDQGWVSTVMAKTHKSPISRIRTRQADVRGDDLDASGYKKGAKKNVSGNIKLLKRTTDPQTIYRKDALHRDDILDITDFDVVEYQYGIMRQNLYEEIAKSVMIGDGRDDGDEAKIEETHVRSIWHDDELYTIHADVDVVAAKRELQGTGTAVSFGDNYVYAEAILTAALYAREQYKGSGNLDFYCEPHLLNVMLLARDMNGRRIYDSKADLANALNVSSIQTAEQFAGKTRTTSDEVPKTKKLLGIFVNLADYQIGSTKGGEITRFNQFDIDFNQEKYLIETRISGALTRIKSAIALEEVVAAAPAG